MIEFISCTIIFLIAVIAIVVIWVGGQPGHRRCSDKFYCHEDRRNGTERTDPFGRPFFKNTRIDSALNK